MAVAIDDFGTGYSSLARLGDLPVDVIKIDRSFVHDLGSGRGEAVLSGIVTLAHALDTDVIAEGVQTLEQLRSLSALGVDAANGYLLARPAVPEHLPMALPAAASGRPRLQMHPSVARVPRGSCGCADRNAQETPRVHTVRTRRIALRSLSVVTTTYQEIPVQHPRQDRTRTYEGRPLPRPDEELVDQGLGFDVGTLLSRRRLLAVFGLGAASIGLAACGAGGSTSSSSASSSSATATPAEISDETAGPYPGDGSNGPDVLEQSGIVRSDIRSSFGGSSGTAEGVPMTLELTLADLANGGVPFEGVAVYVWHCTREGGYSLYSSGVEDQNYLRGVQVADADGTVTFTSIVPACYTGRWPHVHFEVYPDQASITDSTSTIATSQVALPQDVCEAVYATAGYEASLGNLSRVSLSGDNVFGDDGGAGQLATVTGDVSSGYRVSLTVGVDTRTTPAGGGPGGPGGPPPGGS